MKVFSKGGFLGLAGARSVISLLTGVIYFLIIRTLYFKFLFGFIFM